MGQGGVFKSEDGGVSWKQLLTEAVKGPFDRRTASVLLDPKDPKRVVVCCSDQRGSAVFSTVDGGLNWKEGGRGPSDQAIPLMNPVLDPEDRQGIYAIGDDGLLRSNDFGATWNAVSLPDGVASYIRGARSLVVDQVSGRLYFVNDSGELWRSSDRGQSWSRGMGPWGPGAKMLALDPLRPESTFYVASFGSDESPGAHRHAFVARLDRTGEVQWATLLGGSQSDFGLKIGLDAEGNPVVAGTTNSVDFPLQNPSQGEKGLGTDVFVARLSASGDKLMFSTYLGGRNEEQVNGMDLDGRGNVFLAGETHSTDYPVSAGAFQLKKPGLFKSGFVTELNPTSGKIVYSTYLGGYLEDRPGGIVVDADGGAWVTRQTRSSDFPVVNGFQSSIGPSGGSFLARFSAGGNTIDYSTFLGLESAIEGLVLDRNGGLWVHGRAGLRSPFYDLKSDSRDLGGAGFAAKFELGLLAAAPRGEPRIDSTYNAASYLFSRAVSPGSIVTLFGSELAGGSVAAQTARLPRELGGTRVMIGGVDAPLYYVAPGQVNFEVPVETPVGIAEVVVERAGRRSAPWLVKVDEQSPGIFSGGGGPLVLHSADYRLVTEQNPARPGEYLVVYLTGLGLTSPAAVTGEPNPPGPAQSTAGRLGEVVVDSRLALTTYAGLAPGFVGLYQVNFQVNVDEAPGRKWVYVSGSNQVPIFVR